MDFWLKDGIAPVSLTLSLSLPRASLPLSGFRDGWNSRPHFGRPCSRPATKVDRAGTKMTGPPSASYLGQVPLPAAVISPENEEKSSGFDRNFAGFVLRRPAAIFGDPDYLIFELGFGRFWVRDSGHFRKLGRRFGVFRPPEISQGTHALPARVAARGLGKWTGSRF
ncbi:unnamed protein product [Prunus armeniaca]